MSDQSNTDPSQLDPHAVEYAEGIAPAEYELDDVDPYLDEADREVRIDAAEGDDLPVSPPDMQPRASEREMAGITDGEETIDQRIAQEEPDPDSAYGAPDDEGGLNAADTLGGDDQDAIPADRDILGVPDSPADTGEDDPGELSPEQAALNIDETR